VCFWRYCQSYNYWLFAGRSRDTHLFDSLSLFCVFCLVLGNPSLILGMRRRWEGAASFCLSVCLSVCPSGRGWACNWWPADISSRCAKINTGLMVSCACRQSRVCLLCAGQIGCLLTSYSFCNMHTQCEFWNSSELDILLLHIFCGLKRLKRFYSAWYKGLALKHYHYFLRTSSSHLVPQSPSSASRKLSTG